MGKLINLVGQKFGRLTVLERAENQGRYTMWLCQCDCGNSCIVRGEHLKNGKTNSCKCYQRKSSKERATKHSLSGTRLYRIYNCMKHRCYDKKHKHYNNYGGREITICDEWLNDRKNFFSWAMKNGYQDDLSIDRIDNDKGYSPDNCRWATRSEQQHNKRCKKTP